MGDQCPVYSARTAALPRESWNRCPGRRSSLTTSPWIAYDDRKNIYLNTDNTFGMMWECAPLAFASETSIKTLEGIFRVNLPEGSVIQFILFADPFVEPIVNAYGAQKTRSSKLVHDVSDNVMRFFQEGWKVLAV